MFAKHQWCHDRQYCDIYRLKMMSLRAASVSIARFGFDKALVGYTKDFGEAELVLLVDPSIFLSGGFMGGPGGQLRRSQYLLFVPIQYLLVAKSPIHCLPLCLSQAYYLAVFPKTPEL